MGARSTASVGSPQRLGLQSRETLLLLTLAALMVSFVITGFVARLYHRSRGNLAQNWYRRGIAEMNAGRAAPAIPDFEAALIYGREDVSGSQQRAYELSLAEALSAAGSSSPASRAEARAYLLDLWQESPGNGQINLELARLAAESGDDTAARQYYDDAIGGVWDGNADQVARSRRQARLELFYYLYGMGQRAAALSVLSGIAAALPPDATLHGQIAELMVQIGDTQQAFEQFQNVLLLKPRDAPALEGAGLAAFALGDDRAAVRYLEQVSRDPLVAQPLEIARAGLDLDVDQPGLSAAERASRAAHSFQSATGRLGECAAALKLPLTPAASGDPLQVLYAQSLKMQSSARESVLARDPQDIAPVLGLAFAIETAAAQRCGMPARPADAALLRIAARHDVGPGV